MNRFVREVACRFVAHHHLDLIHNADYAEGIGYYVCNKEPRVKLHQLFATKELWCTLLTYDFSEYSHSNDYDYCRKYSINDVVDDIVLRLNEVDCNN